MSHRWVSLLAVLIAASIVSTAWANKVVLKRDPGLLPAGPIDPRFTAAAVVTTTVSDTCLYNTSDSAKYANSGALAVSDGQYNLFKFDLDALVDLPGGTINLAQLRLYHTHGNNILGTGAVAVVTTHNWTEGKGKSSYPGSDGGASLANPNGFNTGPDQNAQGGVAPPLASWGKSSSSFFDIAADCLAPEDPSSISIGEGYNVINVTSDVSQWVSGTRPNYGWANASGSYDFYLSESGSDWQPALFIDYLPGPLPHPGDANRDGVVNVLDLAALATNYDTLSGATWAKGDFNADGAVNVLDLGVLATNYNWPAAGSPVPEPATAGLLTLALAATLRRRR